LSADDGYIVSELYSSGSKSAMRMYGIFYYLGNWPDTQDRTERNAMMISISPIRAILLAHQQNKRTKSEYGVSVEEVTLMMALNEFHTSDIIQET
jgi:ABC-type polysaccharide/polyol phosphate export permease